MSKLSYRVVPITVEDTDRILNFLRRFFFRDEPLNVAVNLLGDSTTCVELEEYCSKSLAENLSLMAVTSEGDQIIGVCINGEMRAEDEEALHDEAEQCPNPKFQKILRLLARIGHEADIFNRFNIDRLFDIRVLSVDSACRGQRIATTLLQHSLQLAREKGFPLYKVDCSSQYSARAVASLGLKPIYSLKYADHKHNGIQELSPELPHTEARTYVLEL